MKFIVLALLVLSCDGPIEPDWTAARRQAQKDTQNITYTKDLRTKLCFATAGWMEGNSATITNVPCSPEVEKLIQVSK